MTHENNYEAELRAANEELYKHSLELARLKKALEISKEQELAKAKEVSRLRDEFVFLAVHELRAPVIAIRGFLELTDSAGKNFPKDIQEYLSAISQASGHLNQLVNDILEIARSESGAVPIVMQPHQFKPIIDDALKETMSLIEEKKIKLTVKIEEIPNVLCDESKIKEVLMNLITNAIKYNRDNGVIDITAYRPPGEPTMLFEIRDNGYGIPKEQQERIFEKFFRAPTEETESVLGTGLGLFITRMLIEKMGGVMTFSSVEHEGTTFTFTIPLAETK